jgi:hypothetical protein
MIPNYKEFLNRQNDDLVLIGRKKLLNLHDDCLNLNKNDIYEA